MHTLWKRKEIISQYRNQFSALGWIIDKYAQLPEQI